MLRCGGSDLRTDRRVYFPFGRFRPDKRPMIDRSADGDGLASVFLLRSYFCLSFSRPSLCSRCALSCDEWKIIRWENFHHQITTRHLREDQCIWGSEVDVVSAKRCGAERNKLLHPYCIAWLSDTAIDVFKISLFFLAEPLTIGFKSVRTVVNVIVGTHVTYGSCGSQWVMICFVCVQYFLFLQSYRVQRHSFWGGWVQFSGV